MAKPKSPKSPLPAPGIRQPVCCASSRALHLYLVVIALLIIAGFIGIGWPTCCWPPAWPAYRRTGCRLAAHPPHLQRLAGSPFVICGFTPGSGSAPAGPSACRPGACASEPGRQPFAFQA